MDNESISYEYAAGDPKWRGVMDEEIRTIKKNDTQELAKFQKKKKHHWNLMSLQAKENF